MLCTAVLVAGIHVFAAVEDVDGRDKPGHDGKDRGYFNHPFNRATVSRQSLSEPANDRRR